MQNIRKPIKVVFTGPPGCGKGTYARILCRIWDTAHVSTGDLIRSLTACESTPVRDELTKYTSTGLLVPDHVVTELCKDRLRQHEVKGWILDGFPRTLQQAKSLEEFSSPQLCVNFQIPKNIVLQKLMGRRTCLLCGGNFNLTDIREGSFDMPAILPSGSCRCSGRPPLGRREDDTPAIIEKRIQIYESETLPVIRYYEEMGRLMSFRVHRGVKDTPQLEQMIFSYLRRCSWSDT